MHRSAALRGGRARLLVALVATAALVVPLVWLWAASLTPGAYSVMDMGYADGGGGPVDSSHEGAHGHGGAPGTAPVPGATRSVTDLAGPATGRPDVEVTLVARRERARLASGRTVDGAYTLNGSTPGPTIRAARGQVVQVRLVNESVPAGVSLHWHGLDVPNAEDGVAGVTQDAVAPGQQHVYRFVPDQEGTFWYHSHQLSADQVRDGLLGALVVTPPAADGKPAPAVDVVALMHLYRGVRTVNGLEGDVPVEVAADVPAVVRVINTENGASPVWVAGAPFRVVAVDGTAVHEPGPLRDVAVEVAAGGRVDLEVRLPADGAARVQLAGPTGMVLRTPGARSPSAVARPRPSLDLLSYGRPEALGVDPARADRRFRYDVGRRPGFLGGRPGLWWSINGHLYPDVPMFVVSQGDVVRMVIGNHSGQPHPMHLHGHHAVVLSRNGVAATGSPWWTDSLTVADGDRYEIAFVADNPGIWVDHCHHLPHARQGLLAHLMYTGVTTPFVIGGRSGNHPE